MRKIKRDATLISSAEQTRVVSVTICATCRVRRSLDDWAQAARSSYAHTCVDPKLHCVRAFLQLQEDSVAMITFFQGTRLISTAPTQEIAEKHLSDWPVVASRITNVFACGAAGKSLDLESIRKKATTCGMQALFDGTKKRHVLRLTLKEQQTHVDVFASGRFTIKSRSVQAAYDAGELIIKDFALQRQ